MLNVLKRFIAMAFGGFARGFGRRLGNDAAREVERDAESWLNRR